MAGPAPAAKKGKQYQVWKIYEKSGEGIKRKNKTCPKCGAGYFMAAHKDRVTCGKCGYMEKVVQHHEKKK